MPRHTGQLSITTVGRVVLQTRTSSDPSRGQIADCRLTSSRWRPPRMGVSSEGDSLSRAGSSFSSSQIPRQREQRSTSMPRSVVGVNPSLHFGQWSMVWSGRRPCVMGGGTRVVVAIIAGGCIHRRTMITASQRRRPVGLTRSLPLSLRAHNCTRSTRVQDGAAGALWNSRLTQLLGSNIRRRDSPRSRVSPLRLDPGREARRTRRAADGAANSVASQTPGKRHNS